MAGESSFDVVSDFDAQELRNALDQVRREVAQRFDFKGSKWEILLKKAQRVARTNQIARNAWGRKLFD